MEYHAVIVGEDGSEFGRTFQAEDRAAAHAYVEEYYPCGRLVQLESPADTAAREARIYAAALLDEDYDSMDYLSDLTDDEMDELDLL